MKMETRIPRQLLEEKPYRNMSDEARNLYLCLAHLKETVSSEKNWIDNHGFRYLVITKKEMQDAFGYSRYMLDKYMQELELLGLIRFEYVRKNSFERRTYVKSFDLQTDEIHRKSVGKGAEKGKEELVNRLGEKTEEVQNHDSENFDPVNELAFARLYLKSITVRASKLEEKLRKIHESLS